MNKHDKILIAGSRGMVGSAIIRELESKGYTNLLKIDKHDIDLLRQADTESFFDREKPDYVFLAAAKVGGIIANSTFVADFIFENICIACNVIPAAKITGVKKLLNLGSSCIYPRLAPQPLKEEYLLTGSLEPTNEPYAIAKIAAIKLCRYFNEQYGTNFISAMPTNLYGPYDNFNLETSHVLPALISKIHLAKINNETSVLLWGDGSPRRDFLYVDDLARALVYIMEKYDYHDIGEFINIGTGVDCTIQELAALISEIIGYKGTFDWDTTKPNGMPQKLLDVSRIHNLGWKSSYDLSFGLMKTYNWFKTQYTEV